ncbi:CRIB domain-containing protein RIC6-like [Cynara cardunculus var. scolymus]|uniref:CRIB domain-containing protein RIC6-like n=1 Tax=Cynara cardunculus var. scolymus TaxID=59895 RepID=UPI000D625F30|nr:CRIB domain-containing protein RIC6-like [Cynara cardunculus var. scolymus]
MGTKVKGFFKGLKNISNIFDEEKEEQEIQIGMPTDVKHVAHIGGDGPAVESPSWMKEFDSGHNQSGPLDGSSLDSPDTRKGTRNHRASRSEELNRELPDMPKPSKHRHRSMDDSLDPDSQMKDSSTKPKRTRRHRLRRRSQEKGDESPDTNLPDIPKKKTRRKKSNEDGGSTRSKDSEPSNNEPNLD